MGADCAGDGEMMTYTECCDGSQSNPVNTGFQLDINGDCSVCGRFMAIILS